MALERTAAGSVSMADRAPPPVSPSVTVRIRYFAVLREERGRDEELLQTDAATACELYDELRERFSFSLDPERLRVACNGDFVPWDQPLRDGDLVVFIPPVAGG